MPQFKPQLQPRRIHQLDNRLANQIAAGEVVERPASVVKELLENSIDSGATRIEVDIERGGTRLIRITDNGNGIHKDDLSLALTRHATSKIQTTEDLSAIETLGFRGEALASISSVSRLTLTSRTQDSELAWQAIAQGRDMAVEILPASAASGTRIEVAELFYNTPARQKFMRTEKTEFGHIEEVFKQHALVNPEIAFVLKHNHKVVKRVAAIGEESQSLRRIADICGKRFAENIIRLDCFHDVMNISGYIGSPEFHRSESDIQYVFINGRPVKDKTLNHAIRQAYEGLIPPGRMATYVIFIEMAPSAVDVNVHPTKHEVRFDQQRFVHDLLAKSIEEQIRNFKRSTDLFASHNNEAKEVNSETRQDVEPSDAQEINSDRIHTFEPSTKALDNRLNTRIENASDSDIKNYSNSDSKSYSKSDSKSYSKSDSTSSYPKSSLERSNLVSNNRKSVYRPSSNQSSFRTQLVREGAKQFSPVDNGNFNTTEFPLIRMNNRVWLTEVSEQCVVFDINELLAIYIENLIAKKTDPISKGILFPFKMEFSDELLEDFNTHAFFERMGFVTRTSESSELAFLKVPFWLSSVSIESIQSLIAIWISKIAELKSLENICGVTLIKELTNILELNMNKEQIAVLLANLNVFDVSPEESRFLKSLPAEKLMSLLTGIDANSSQLKRVE